MLDEIENPIQYIIHVIDYILDLKEFITEGFVMQSTWIIWRKLYHYKKSNKSHDVSTVNLSSLSSTIFTWAS